ncbi:MAG: nucleotide sugar dehydrogenase [Sneathiella sp.]|uniref:nucleotide sugar dehydrogenase n=1 Tax=Sneathiella sp. TaxID=1964365 RepID=UPI0030018AA3
MTKTMNNTANDVSNCFDNSLNNILPRLSIFGLGYVGAVSAACFAELGHQVIGIDPDARKVACIKSGKAPIVEPGLNDLLSKGIGQSLIDASYDAAFGIAESDISFVCVGTPSASDGRCDLKYLEQVSRDIGKALRNKEGYHVVIFRSTIPPGTTNKILKPILESESGKKAGVDFGLGFHPEFLRESTAIEDFYEPPKTVIGGIDQQSKSVIAAMYAGIDDTVIETSIEAAEMVKYVDNTWHALKVSFANEIGKICQAAGVDSHEVMDIFAKDTKLNISSYYMKPGYAFGGSCLPKDVRGINHLASDYGLDTPILRNIIASNEAQIAHAAEIVEQTRPKTIAFLGVTFKADTDDLRESPVLPLIENLLDKGYDVRIYDQNLDLESSVRHHLQHSKHSKSDKVDLMSRLPEFVCTTAKSACQNADTIVVSHSDEAFRKVISSRQSNQKVVDLVRIFSQRQGWQEMFDAGMNDYIQKPAQSAMIEEKLMLWTQKPEHQGLSILLAEDDPVNAAVILSKLKKFGHAVHVVANGREAVEVASIKYFDVVLMDVLMPEMNGIEATQKIRALSLENQTLPILALTAHAMPEQSATYSGICW